MPFPRAHYYVIGLLLLSFAGFWPFYWSRFTEASWTFHLHGLTGTAWLLLLIGQSWSIHHKNVRWHRLIGRASLVLFPLLMAGFAASILRVAEQTSSNNIFFLATGPAFLVALILSMAAYLLLYYQALRNRWDVWTHAGYMLSTPFLLWEASASRIIVGFVPGFGIAGPQDFPHLVNAVLASMFMALALLIYLWMRDRKRRRPFLLTALVIAVQMAAIAILRDSDLVREMLRAIYAVPVILLVSVAFLIASLVAWAGWEAGKRTAVSGRRCSAG